MPELVWKEHGVRRLRERGISEQDVLEWESGPRKAFRNRRGGHRLRIIGPDGGGRLLTIIVEPDEDGMWEIVTGWPSTGAEQTLYSRPGGRYAR